MVRLWERDDGAAHDGPQHRLPLDDLTMARVAGWLRIYAQAA